MQFISIIILRFQHFYVHDDGFLSTFLDVAYVLCLACSLVFHLAIFLAILQILAQLICYHFPFLVLPLQAFEFFVLAVYLSILELNLFVVFMVGLYSFILFVAFAQSVLARLVFVIAVYHFAIFLVIVAFVAIVYRPFVLFLADVYFDSYSIPCFDLDNLLSCDHILFLGLAILVSSILVCQAQQIRFRLVQLHQLILKYQLRLLRLLIVLNQ